MVSSEIQVVTGAFGFSGKYIAGCLLNKGYRVHTLTNSPGRENPFNGTIKAFPFHFDNFDRLIESLQGGKVLYNNYWVRFNNKHFNYSEAVDNTLKLFKAAKTAGIQRIVHISITNPSESSPFEYFKGKAILEKALTESGISYAILRPAIIFGREDILINNIAWFLRTFPVFGVFGDGSYRMQPIYAGDIAELAVEMAQGTENRIIDAIGPETFTYRELVAVISRGIGKVRPIISINPKIGHVVGLMVGKFFNDVTITRDEIDGLMSDLLYTKSLPVGKTKFTEWLKENTPYLGMRYRNELARRMNRENSYDVL